MTQQNWIQAKVDATRFEVPWKDIHPLLQKELISHTRNFVYLWTTRLAALYLYDFHQGDRYHEKWQFYFVRDNGELFIFDSYFSRGACTDEPTDSHVSGLLQFHIDRNDFENDDDADGDDGCLLTEEIANEMQANLRQQGLAWNPSCPSFDDYSEIKPLQLSSYEDGFRLHQGEEDSCWYQRGREFCCELDDAKDTQYFECDENGIITTEGKFKGSSCLALYFLTLPSTKFNDGEALNLNHNAISTAYFNLLYDTKYKLVQEPDGRIECYQLEEK